MEMNKKILTGVAWLSSLIAGGCIVSKIERNRSINTSIKLIKNHALSCEKLNNEINELKAQMEEDRHKVFNDGFEAGADSVKKIEEIFKKFEEAE